MKTKSSDQLPMPSDQKIGQVAREAIESNDLGSLEEYIFGRERAEPGWIYYMALDKACKHARPEQANDLELIADRWQEINVSATMYEMVLWGLQEMYERLGDELGKARCVKKRRALYAKLQDQGHPDAP